MRVELGAEPRAGANFNSKIAQLVEHSVVTRKVGGSLPSLGANFNRDEYVLKNKLDR